MSCSAARRVVSLISIAAMQHALHVHHACCSHTTTMLLNEDDGKGASAQQCSEALFCM